MAIYKKIFLLSVGSSILLILTLPPYDLSLCAWVSLVPLLYITLKYNPKHYIAILAYLLTGLISCFFALNWIMAYQKRIFFIVWPLCTLIFPLFGFVINITCRLIKNSFIRTLIIPSIWILLMKLYSFTYIGSHWCEEFFAHSQNNLYLIQSAGLFGTMGLTFLIIYCNASVCLAFVHRGKFSKLLPAPVVICILAILFYGHNQLSRSGIQKENTKVIKIALIQPGISGEAGLEHITPMPEPGIEFACFPRNAEFPIFSRLNLEAQEKEPDLIIWPQYNLPVDVTRQTQKTSDILRDFYARFAKPILIGAFIYRDSKVVNISLLLDENGNVSGMRSLVAGPPFRKEIQPIGKELDVLDFSPFWLPRSFKLGPLLCYEDVSSGYALELIRKGADLLVVQVNNEVFQKTRLPEMHFRRDIFRAIENRRWLVRAATTGISAIIDPYGRIVDRIDLGKEEIKYIRLKIPVNKYETFFAKHRDIINHISLVIVLLTIVAGTMQRIRMHNQQL